MTSRPGLQPERTALAWNRTALGAAALAGTLVKVASEDHRVLDIVCAAVTGLAAAVIWYCGRLRAAHEVRPGPVPRRLYLTVELCAVVACLAAALTMLARHS